jgi:hypothetical protein
MSMCVCIQCVYVYKNTLIFRIKPIISARCPVVEAHTHMYMYTCICMYIYIIYIYTHTHTHIYICMYIYMHINTHSHSHTHTHIQVCSSGLCPVEAYGGVPEAATVHGEASFSGLTCTRMSCSPGCTSCGPGNCLPAGAYVLKCSVTGGECEPCEAFSQTFHVVPNSFSKVGVMPIGLVVAGSNFEGRSPSGFFEVRQSEQGLLRPEDLVPMQPRMKLADIYGNLNAQVPGAADVSVAPGTPNMAGFDFCQRNGGHDCLEGDYTSQVVAGLATFTNLFVRQPGLGYQLRFSFAGINGYTRLFNALPPPPRMVGIAFSPSFSDVLLNFDVDTNRANMGNSLDCSLILSQASIQTLGAGATCSWRGPRTVVITLGNNARITPTTPFSLSPTVRISTSITWAPVVQTDSGLAENDRVGSGSAGDPRAQSLTSVLAPPSFFCRRLMLPQRLTRMAVLPPSEAQAAVSATATFEVQGTRYWAVASQCTGVNCQVLGATNQVSLDLNIYRLGADGLYSRSQVLPSYGAVELKTFETVDARKVDGGYETRNFLLVVNSLSAQVRRSA